MAWDAMVSVAGDTYPTNPDSKGMVKCIFCGGKFQTECESWIPFLCPVTKENKNAEAASDMKRHVEHCKNHAQVASLFKGGMAWTIKETFNTKDLIQNRLNSAFMQCPVRLSSVETVLNNNHDGDLREDLTGILHAAIAHNRDPTTVTGLANFRKGCMKGRTNVGAWCKLITPRLKEILAAMLSFDYSNWFANIPEDKVPIKIRPLLLWHELNVFFMRGVYFKQPFPWPSAWENLPPPPPQETGQHSF